MVERMRIGECKRLGGKMRSIRESKEEMEKRVLTNKGEVGRKGWENQRSQLGVDLREEKELRDRKSGTEEETERRRGKMIRTGEE